MSKQIEPAENSKTNYRDKKIRKLYRQIIKNNITKDVLLEQLNREKKMVFWKRMFSIVAVYAVLASIAVVVQCLGLWTN